MGGSFGADGGAVQTPRLHGLTLMWCPERSSRHSKRATLSSVEVLDFTTETSSPLRPVSSFKFFNCFTISQSIDGSARKTSASGFDASRSFTTSMPLGFSSLIAITLPSWSPAPTSRKIWPGMNFLAMDCDLRTQLFPRASPRTEIYARYSGYVETPGSC